MISSEANHTAICCLLSVMEQRVVTNLLVTPTWMFNRNFKFRSWVPTPTPNLLLSQLSTSQETNKYSHNLYNQNLGLIFDFSIFPTLTHQKILSTLHSPTISNPSTSLQIPASIVLPWSKPPLLETTARAFSLVSLLRLLLILLSFTI